MINRCVFLGVVNDTVLLIKYLRTFLTEDELKEAMLLAMEVLEINN